MARKSLMDLPFPQRIHAMSNAVVRQRDAAEDVMDRALEHDDEPTFRELMQYDKMQASITVLAYAVADHVRENMASMSCGAWADVCRADAGGEITSRLGMDPHEELGRLKEASHSGVVLRTSNDPAFGAQPSSERELSIM